MVFVQKNILNPNVAEKKILVEKKNNLIQVLVI
jgi:hypothetical protein